MCLMCCSALQVAVPDHLERIREVLRSDPTRAFRFIPTSHKVERVDTHDLVRIPDAPRLLATALAQVENSPGLFVLATC
jgi:hypothetical protein